MPKLSAEALNTAIRAVRDADLRGRAAAPLEVLLVFRRLGSPANYSIEAVDRVVAEHFVLLPDHADGRLGLAGGETLWQRVAQSGRMTVWNNATRHRSKALFDPPLAYVQETGETHPLAEDPVDRVLGLMPPRSRARLLPRDVLAAVLLRGEEWPEGAGWDEVVAGLRERFDLLPEELDRLTGPPTLADIAPLAGPAWSPEALPTDLLPPEAGASPPTPGARTPERPARDVAVVPLRFDERTERMVRVSLLSTSAVLLVGPPGTGKTRLLRRVMEDLLDHHPDFDGLGSPLWRTPEESWTARDVVGGTTVAPGGELRFRPGAVPRALADNRWLVLDEVNRGDADRIFGGLITWLSDQPVEIGQVLEQPQSPVVRLEWDEESLGSGCEREDQLTAEEPSDDVVYRAGRAWRLLGTYNGQDAQRVFRFGQALGRRFQQVPVPAMEPEDFDLVLIEIDAAQGLTVEVTERLSKIYEAHHAADVTRFGPASFFEMRGYLIGALDAAEPTEGRQPGQVAAPGPATVGELLAEAYVVNLGQRLSLLDDPDRAALRARQVEAGAFTEDDWDWLERRIRDFG